MSDGGKGGKGGSGARATGAGAPILCAGEALIDMVPIPGGYAPLPGGSVFNTAVGLGRLGVATAFLSGLSRDPFGRRLAAALEAAGVDHSLAVRSHRPTTLAFVDLAGGEASYTFYDENSAGRMLAPADLSGLPADPGRLAAAFFGGISLSVEPAGAAYEALAGRLAPHGPVVLDPNVRPAFVARAGEEAGYRARLGRLVALADILKLSVDDLDWLVPGEGAPEAKLERLAPSTALAVLTLGGEGALARTPRGLSVRVPAVPARVVDTVGAGDSFGAGLLARLHGRGLLSRPALAALAKADLEDALAFAARVAALTVGRAGADPPWLREIG